MAEIIELPDPVKYYQFFKFDEIAEFKNKYVYVFKHYPDDIGFMIIVIRKNDIINYRLADFSGKIINPIENTILSPHIKTIVEQYLNKLILTIKAIGVKQCIFYFSIADRVRLVDIRLSLNKMCGPGYLKDFFGKQDIPIQEEVCSPLILTDENIVALKSKEGMYKHGKFVIKPSVFKVIIKDEDLIPMYGSII